MDGDGDTHSKAGIVGGAEQASIHLTPDALNHWGAAAGLANGLPFSTT